MPPEAATHGGADRPADIMEQRHRVLVLIGGTWLALILVFAPDWMRMVDQWWNSSTYNHMLLVPPIAAWLAWQRRGSLSEIAPVPFSPGLGIFALLLGGWALGAMSGFDLLRQATVVAMLPASVLLLAGSRVVAALLFPLSYMAFMVPFGDELVPQLQMITAGLTIALVKLSAIPATIDGVFIKTPAGLFEVAEACSGVKFLIAMVALGAFVANVGFRSWYRRAAFMSLCVIAPILGNGVRAFGTIFAAQYIGAERAGGVDHLIYGWVFFALIIALVLALAWRWFDRPLDDPIVDAATHAASPLLAVLDRLSISSNRAFAGLAALVAATLLWVGAAEGRSAHLPAHIVLPDVPGWHRVDYAPAFPWEPRAAGAEHRLLGRYADSDGNTVDVFFALYSAQREGQEAGGFGEGALRSDSGWSWQSTDSHGLERLRADTGTERLANTYFRTGDVLTGSNARLKIAALSDKAMLRSRPTGMLILSSEKVAGADPQGSLARFQHAIGPVAPWMDRIGAGR